MVGLCKSQETQNVVTGTNTTRHEGKGGPATSENTNAEGLNVGKAEPRN